MRIQDTAEYKRLQEGAKTHIPPWKKWGTYVSDRAWGTVREDYSANGEAWSYFPHDHAALRAYRWNEDGIAGLCDRYQVLNFSFAFWNGKDPLLKERFYGLGTWEGNHGEDVKEYYYYLDATPTFSYMKFLYKYPQSEYPYRDLWETNKNRNQNDLEYELIDTGIFDQNEYFDIFVEYAKEGPDDICIKMEIFNRANQAASLHVIPQLWFRNQWSWFDQPKPQPIITMEESKDAYTFITDDTKSESPHKVPYVYHLGKRYLYSPKGGEPLFTNNETNKNKLWGLPNDTPFVKDAFHGKVIRNEDCTNSKMLGTKAAVHYCFKDIPAKSSRTLRLRLTNSPLKYSESEIDAVIAKRKKEADEFYDAVQSKTARPEEKAIQRQAIAGLIWSQQFYHYDVSVWLVGDNTKNPPPQERKNVRNNHWRHLNSLRIFAMPDKWEYPWFAAWDLAFHTVTLALVDSTFAKEQLWLLLFDQFQHPNGEVPAYEWEFSDVNPPVQAWACLKVFEIEKKQEQKEDYDFLEQCFHKLLLNFAWWINRVDVSGRNIFEGGFLGLDNITMIDRSLKHKDGTHLDETDASGWMSMFCLNLTKIALILSKKNPNYELLATKFFEHFVYIAAAMRKGYWRDYDMWDETDGFFYSMRIFPDGSRQQFRIRSLVGVIPFFALDILDEKEAKAFPRFFQYFTWFLEHRHNLVDKCVHKLQTKDGVKYLFALMHPAEMKRFLHYIWDPTEFRSEYGIRSLSKYHEENPYTFQGNTVRYEPGESLERIKGGNSNWRGPIWMPTNYLIIDSLQKIGKVLDSDLQIQVGNENPIRPSQMAKEIAKRLIMLFEQDESGSRPIYGLWEKFQNDPHFNSHPLFFEHYHGDTGRGLGASHQTGWSSLIANLIQDLHE